MIGFLLKVSPKKGVMRFGKKWKLSPRYVGSLKIFQRVGKVSYEFDLPAKLAAMHLVFHISLLTKCVGDPASVMPLKSVTVKDSFFVKMYHLGFLIVRLEGLEIKKSLQSRFCKGVST